MSPKNGLKLRIYLFALLAAVGLAFGMVRTVQAVIENITLSGEVADEGDVAWFEISPDGRFTVFAGDLRTDEKYELFSVPTIGGQRQLLSSGLHGTEGVVDFYISPDSQWVVYLVGSDAINPNQLFSVPIGGGTPIPLFQGDLGNNYLGFVEISADSTTIVFHESLPDTNQDVLRSVAIGGGTPDIIAAPEDEWCHITSKITHDSTKVIYNISEAGCDDHGLYQSNISGAGTITLDPNHVIRFEITPEDDFVIFTQGSPAELYSIPVGGGGKETLNDILVPGGKVYHDFKITPDNQYVVYRAVETTAGMDLLYRVPVDGSETSLNLTPWEMVFGGDVDSFKITPNSLGVVYLGDGHLLDQMDLYAVPITGAASPFRLSMGMIDEGDVVEYDITPNNLGVIFIADGRTDEVYELFGALINGSYITPLNLAHPSYAFVEDFEISNNSQFVVYRAPIEETGPLYLLIVPSIGGVPQPVNPEPVFGGFVHPYYRITPDSKGIVYRADQDVDNQIELFITFNYEKQYLPLMTK